MKTGLRKFIYRVIQAVIFLVILSILVFILSRLAPGDPMHAYYGDALERMSAEQIEAARARLSLDDGPVTQYLTWAGRVLQGDFGISFQYKEAVSSVIGDYWLNTLLLGGISFVLTFVLATLLGIYCASRHGRLIDKLIHKLGVLSSTVPTFFLALMLILIFAVNLKILPSGGATALDGSGRGIYLILPAFTLIFTHLWYYAYIIRNKMIRELDKDYVQLCRVKGIKNGSILFRHCLKNISPSIISLMVVSLPHILGGTYIVEMVFSYPGLGMLSFESAKYHDYNMLLMLCLITGLVVIVGNMIGEEVSELIDPRMRRRGVPA